MNGDTRRKRSYTEVHRDERRHTEKEREKLLPFSVCLRASSVISV